jgi:hypothetical protein
VRSKRALRQRQVLAQPLNANELSGCISDSCAYDEAAESSMTSASRLRLDSKRKRLATPTWQRQKPRSALPQTEKTSVLRSAPRLNGLSDFQPAFRCPQHHSIRARVSSDGERIESFRPNSSRGPMIGHWAVNTDASCPAPASSHQCVRPDSSEDCGRKCRRFCRFRCRRC